jgi:hypothetical protein
MLIDSRDALRQEQREASYNFCDRTQRASMSNSLLHAFFLGRATAEVLSEQIGHRCTSVLAEIGKFDAEQRERLREFTTQVMERASQEEGMNVPSDSAHASASSRPGDLQTTIDELRAEIARLRSELQSYRNRQA